MFATVSVKKKIINQYLKKEIMTAFYKPNTGNSVAVAPIDTNTSDKDEHVLNLCILRSSHIQKIAGVKSV